MSDRLFSDGPGVRALNEERLRYFLSIPYVAVFYSEVTEDDEWVRRAEYPELPGCAVEADSAIEAMELLEELRIEFIVNTLARGGEPPAPRPPLQGGGSGLSSETLQSLLRHARRVPE